MMSLQKLQRPVGGTPRMASRPCSGAKGMPLRGQGYIIARATQTTTLGTTRVGIRKLAEAQGTILSTLTGVKGRGKSGLDTEQRSALEQAVEALEANGGVPDVTSTPDVLDGRWRLLYTSRPGTASPIQNTFTGVDSFSVFQDVDLSGSQPSITNVVDFGPSVGYLRVEALASTDSRPLEGFTPRQGAGLPLFGKSFTNPPARPNMRIDFQFDNAAFHFRFLPFTIPYPVPFRLLGDETKGWLDVTYTSPDGSFRLSRGNKGTLFILVREQQVKAQLVAAIKAGDDDKVVDLVQFMALDNPTKTPARSPKTVAKWRLVWSQQAPDAGPLQKFGSKQADSFQIISQDGSLQNLVQLFGGFVEISANAQCEPAGDARTTVDIGQAGIRVGPLNIPISVPRGKNNPGFVDWLYLDDDMRITRGSKGSLFIHMRESLEDGQE